MPTASPKAGTQMKSGSDKAMTQKEATTQKQEIEAIQQKFQNDFEAVANRLLVESSSRFGQQSAESLDKMERFASIVKPDGR